MLTRRRHIPAIIAATTLAVILAPLPALAAPSVTGQIPVAQAGPVDPAPTTFNLPNGFQPEGIAIGRAPFAYFGSRATGSIYRANLATGTGEVISVGPGTASLGLKLDGRGRLFVAGGGGGNARVIDVATGQVLASYTLQTVPSFINDVVLTRDAAWFTDSTNPVLFRVPFGRGGALPTAAQVQRVPLTGAIVFADGPNANGISATPDGRGLLIVQTNTGLLFRVDPATGVTTQVDLAGQTLAGGDGLLLSGNILYVVQNRQNTLAKVRVDPAGTRGEVLARVTDPRFDVPTTVASFGPRLYLVNSRFTTPPTADTEYQLVAVPRP